MKDLKLNNDETLEMVVSDIEVSSIGEDYHHGLDEVPEEGYHIVRDWTNKKNYI